MRGIIRRDAPSLKPKNTLSVNFATSGQVVSKYSLKKYSVEEAKTDAGRYRAVYTHPRRGFVGDRKPS
jgi:hypothetical protein